MFNVLKFGPGNSPPFILYMAEGRPCCENLMRRAKEVTLDFLSDKEKVRPAGARGVVNFHQKQKMKGV